jgi:hypothetical protein
MSSKPQRSAAQKVSSSKTFQRQKAKPGARVLTSDAILDDIAEFKKRGGRIDVLGNTAFRSSSTSTAFTSRRTAALKKPPTPVADAGKSSD